MNLIIVTRKIDEKKMYINPNQVCAVYSGFLNEKETIIQFSGSNNFAVLESVDTVADMIGGCSKGTCPCYKERKTDD